MRVAVTGVGAVSAFGWGAGLLQDGLLSGRCAATELFVFDPEGQRTRLAAQVPPRPAPEAGRVRSERFAVFATAEALCAAGWSRLPEETGLFFASTTGGMLEAEEFYDRLHARPTSPRSMRGMASQQNNAPGDQVARRFCIRGPVMTTGSACAAGSMALQCGLDALRAGGLRVVLAGGSDELCRLTYAGFNSLRAIDASPSRPFRRDRAGLTMGEGAAVLVLEPWEQAESRGAPILAEFAGAASSCDAEHMTAPREDGSGAAAAIRGALANANSDPGEIAFINVHGTGTPHNDRSEAAAFASVFRDRLREIPLTSSKAAIGHLLGASGAIEAVATVHGLRAGVVHPTAGNGDIEPESVRLVQNEPLVLSEPIAALSTSLGFGGANAALVFRRTP